MAGDWLPMRCNLHMDPAVIAVAARVGIDEYAVVGRLHRLWAWANEHTSAGDAAVPLTWVDTLCGLQGFAAALSEVGWLTAAEGGFTIPEFERWNSASAKRRLQESRRKQQSRRHSAAQAPAAQAPAAQAPAAQVKKAAKSEPTPRQRDLLFDAIAAATGSDPSIRSVASQIAKAKKSLSEATPSYTPDDVRQFAERYPQLCPWARTNQPTIGELEKYIGRLRGGTVPVANGGAATKGARADGYTIGVLFNSMGGENADDEGTF